VVFGGALYLLKQQADAVAADVVGKQKQIDEIGKKFLPKATDASERLNAIKFVQTSQTKFSVLVADLVKVLPKDVDLESITLTGEAAKPVNMTVTAKTYDQVLALRNALVLSERVAAADIVSISQGTGIWNATLNVAFKPGRAQ
jgi:Tfp pilus assembly protein PilN